MESEEEPPPPVDPPTPPAAAVLGPTGQHWYQRTARPAVGRQIPVAASWTAIAAAISSVTNPLEIVEIVVAPGILSGGNGAGSTATGVLQNLGNAGRAGGRILVRPRDGVGTVEIGAGTGVAFVGVKGVTLHGIDLSAQTIMQRNCEDFAIGYTTVPRILITANGGNGSLGTEWVEVVAGPESANGADYDRSEIKTAGGFNVNGHRIVGCIFAPNCKTNGSAAHCDSIQFVTTSGAGTIQNVQIIDSALFQSADQGIMAANISGGLIDNSGFFGGQIGQLRYPMYSGGDPITLANLLHGMWVGVTVEDSIVAGSISSAWSFASVARSKSTQADRGFDPLPMVTRAQLDALVPHPTPARLSQLWAA